MAIANELKRPASETEFESLCLLLYGKLWQTDDLMPVGRRGQEQFGVDILGFDGTRDVGIQCKFYETENFTMSTIRADVDKADAATAAANLSIQHLIFATTASSKSTVVTAVAKLNQGRRAAGTFTVQVDFWGAICDRIRLHPEVGKAFIPDYPGNTQMVIKDTTSQTLAVTQDIAEKIAALPAEFHAILRTVLEPKSMTPDARGDEDDPGVVAALDLVRDQIRAGKTGDAQEMLDRLEPSKFKDDFSKFRWYTNAASIKFLEGNKAGAADGFDEAFRYASDNLKAHVNRAHAMLLRGDPASADRACTESLEKFPDSPELWGLRLAARNALRIEVPDSEVPPAVFDSPDYLFSRARILDASGREEEAIELLRRCIAADGGSFDVRRVFLADALSWAAKDKVASFMGQITEAQRAALQEGLNAFEPLEERLPAVQANQVAEELATNVTSSLLVLGQEDRARRLARQLLVRHPRLEQLMRVRAAELVDEHNFDELKALIGDDLAAVPPSVLVLVMEATAHAGLVYWNAQLLQEANARASENPKLGNLGALAIHALWRHGDRGAALAAAEQFIHDHPRDIMGRVTHALILDDTGRPEDAKASARATWRTLDPNAESPDRLLLADLLCKLGLHREAAPLYASMVNVPRADELTWKWLVCLVQSDQRVKALEVFNRLPAEARNDRPMRHLEVNLAGAMGDWARMRDLLGQELDWDNMRGDVAVGYASALFRLGQKEQLREFVQRDPQLKEASAEQEIEFSKLQIRSGFHEMAARRLCRLFLRHPNDPSIAGYFLGQIMLAPKLDSFEPPAWVVPGSAVELVRGGDRQWVAIDSDMLGPHEALPWLEIVRPDSARAATLLGHRPGDAIEWRAGLFEEPATIVTITSFMAFVTQKAHAVIDSSANPSGPMWSVRLIKEDGKVNTELLLRTAKERNQRVASTFELYRQSWFPICMLARVLGTDTVRLIMEWPRDQAFLGVAVGSVEERANAFATLTDRRQPVVLDLLTVAEILLRKVQKPVLTMIGRPLVPQTQKEQLLILIDGLSDARESMMLGERDGRLQLAKVPVDYYDGHRRFLQNMLRFIDTQCDIVPTVGIEAPTDDQRAVFRVLDRANRDTLDLCLERRGILMSEDFAFRTLATEMGVEQVLGLQPTLMEALRRGLLTNDAYAEFIASKLGAGHDFVTFNAHDLLYLARKEPTRTRRIVLEAISRIARPTVEFQSAWRACFEFLNLIVKVLEPKVVGQYTMAMLNALSTGREAHTGVLRRMFARAVSHVYGRNGRHLAPSVRREFGGLLKRRVIR